MFDVLDRQHVGDFLDRRVDDEGSTRQRDQALKGELALKEAVEVEPEERLCQCVEQGNDDEEEDNPEQDGQADPPLADHRRLGLANPFGFD